MNGTVKFFNEGKGFGFIAGEDGNEYFVHITGLADGVRLRDNDSVTFDVVDGDRGPKADNVQLGSGDSAPADDSDDSPEGIEDIDEDSDDSDEDSDEDKD